MLTFEDAALGFGETPAFRAAERKDDVMPQYGGSLDVYQGYNFKSEKQTRVGFLTKMKIGDTEFAADQTCKDPMNPTANLNVLGVLSQVLWDTGVTDAIYLTSQISKANRQSIALLTMSPVGINTVFQFRMYEYDEVAKKYFTAFHSNNTDLHGLIEKRGDDMNITVAEDASVEVQFPENYTLQIGIEPRAFAQTLFIAPSDRTNVMKSWGLAAD